MKQVRFTQTFVRWIGSGCTDKGYEGQGVKSMGGGRRVAPDRKIRFKLYSSTVHKKQATYLSRLHVILM